MLTFAQEKDLQLFKMFQNFLRRFGKQPFVSQN